MKSIHIKKEIRKCTAVMLAFVMVFGMLPMAASAEITATKCLSEVSVGDSPWQSNSFNYTGEPIEPLYCLYEGSYYDENKTYLREGIDYVVSYENNIYPDPDNYFAAKATFTGIGKYYGTKTENLLWIDVQSHDSESIPIPGEAEIKGNRLRAACCEVLGIDEFDENLFSKQIEKIVTTDTDSLTNIRLLKEHDTKIFFEKDQIWTFQNSVEILLTLLVSMSQEESRSISENVLWGVRKKMSDASSKHF